MFGLVLAILVVSKIGEAKVFENPVIRGVYESYPGVTYHNGSYYAVTSNDSFTQGPQLHVYQSTDLQNWAFIGYIFSKETVPSWGGRQFYAAEILKLGDHNFRVYFSAGGPYKIGVAFATDIRGPYIPISEPLLGEQDEALSEPTVLNDNGVIRMYWRNWNSTSGFIQGRDLSSDGLRVTSGPVSTVLTASETWEQFGLYAPFIIKRENQYYLFYSGWGYIGVAKSSSPYENFVKRSEPVINTSQASHGSVVLDYVNGTTYVIIFYERISTKDKRIMARSLAWDSDGWPYVVYS